MGAFALAACLATPVASADEAESPSQLGIRLSGQMPTVAGAFAPVLTPEYGGTLTLDIPMPGLKGQTRLLALGGIQNYGVRNASNLSLSTYELGLGARFGSSPYVWRIEPTLTMGLGATFGSLQITDERSEPLNQATYPTAWISPGISVPVWRGLSLGLEMPVRVIYQLNSVITLSPALTLGYDL